MWFGKLLMRICFKLGVEDYFYGGYEFGAKYLIFINCYFILTVPFGFIIKSANFLFFVLFFVFCFVLFCFLYVEVMKALLLVSIKIIIMIMSRNQYGYPWPFLATPLYRPSLPAGLQDYILYRNRDALCRFELVVLPLWRGPQEYVTYELVPTSPAVSRMSGSSNLDSFRDWL